MSSWADFIATVDQTPAPEAVRAKAIEVFEKAGLTSPASAEGVLEGDLDLSAQDASCKALIRRSIRMLDDLANARRSAKMAAGPSAAVTPVAAPQTDPTPWDPDALSGSGTRP